MLSKTKALALGTGASVAEEVGLVFLSQTWLPSGSVVASAGRECIPKAIESKFGPNPSPYASPPRRVHSSSPSEEVSIVWNHEEK
jgi:hypothetical protein